jgi:hypothetical protein
MHILFANTGVQIVCIPLTAGRRYTTAQIGYGWQYTKCVPPIPEDEDEEPVDDEPEPVPFPYIQWQIVQSDVSKLFLAVDTTLGDKDIGHFSDASSLAGDFLVDLEGMLDANGELLQGLPELTLTLRAATATAGDAKPVHVVVDYGNSRTGALLLEVSGEVSQAAEMMPFELFNRYKLETWDDNGKPISRPGSRWFSSKTRWCNSPFLTPQEQDKTEFYRETVKGLFGKKEVSKERLVAVQPRLFDDISLVRMGKEVDDVCQVMHAKGDFRIGLSSPKRYLWADDNSWLEGAFWYMADPYDREETGVFAAKLKGQMLKYLHEDDRDSLLEVDEYTEEHEAPLVPIKPQHAPRSLMISSMYEMLCQIYTNINSLGYRSRTEDPARTREIHSLTMTYPSGMFQPERERFISQCKKAIEIFNLTLGKYQRKVPTLTFSIDEASAVHLTYIWSELRMLGQDPRLWFAALSREHTPTPKIEAAEVEVTEEGESIGSAPAGRRRSTARIRRPGSKMRSRDEEEENEEPKKEIRIACIDIGGGTTDLMIASYVFQPGIDDSVQGRVLHRDGISVAGDQLVKRLLEKIIVPAFSDAIGLEEEDIQILFGPQVPKNRGFTTQRIDWVNRMLVPLAESYIQMAVEGNEGDELNHTDSEIIDPAVLESLDQICTEIRGPGYYALQQDLGLMFDAQTFEDVVHEVFDDLLFDFCSRMVDYETDVVLLAGQPSKIGYLQDLVRTYTPLPSSRIIPMFNHYAGNWYPYQDPRGDSPGRIVDPKSAVVVGAAIEFMARNGMLSQFRFSMTDEDLEKTFYWGVMTESNSTIREDRVLFQPVTEHTRDEWTEFETTTQRTIIGRKMVGAEEAQANPIYVLKMDTEERIGPTRVNIRLRRVPSTEDQDELLELQSVTGEVAGRPAVLGDNVHFKWRTLADERFFLDTGGLDNIDSPGQM